MRNATHDLAAPVRRTNHRSVSRGRQDRPAPLAGPRRRGSLAPWGGEIPRGRSRTRLHGGLSTGPRTPDGLERSRHTSWTHGSTPRSQGLSARASPALAWAVGAALWAVVAFQPWSRLSGCI